MKLTEWERDVLLYLVRKELAEGDSIKDTASLKTLEDTLQKNRTDPQQRIDIANAVY